MKIKTIIASEVAALDSDVRTGGGTDVTAALQAALDEALACGGVRLVMDGAALVHSLHVHSNTTIECLTPDCGFFQKAQSNRAIVSNANWDRYSLKDRNIALIGGTYNQDCRTRLTMCRGRTTLRTGCRPRSRRTTGRSGTGETSI